MDWIGWEHIGLLAGVVLFAIGYFRKRWGLQDALGALTEIRGLVTYATKAMEDGKLSAKERDGIIERVGAVAKRLV